MTRGWWRRNALPLGAVAILLPVGVLVPTGVEWWRWSQADPVFPTTAAAGESVEWAGATWGPATAVDQTSLYAADAPAGTRVLVVEIPVDPGDLSPLCTTPALRELGGAGRQWGEATTEVDWRYERPTSCESGSPVPFTVSVPYLVPDDARGPFGVELTVPDELPGFLRLEVIP
ncbi:hypothetical protein HDC37_001841 [Microbacterium sp. AK009]|nr:hypothetical protein [Microbacterium sp. AK009]